MGNYKTFMTAAIVILLIVVVLYILLLGDLVYQKRSPATISSAVVCELIASAMFTTVVSRLTFFANQIGVGDTDEERGGNNFLRFLSALAVFLFATTAVFVAVLRVGNVQQEEGKGADIRYKPK